VTGVAWLSSARVVRCWVKSRNERNPLLYLPSGQAGNYKDTARDNREEGEDDVKSSRPLHGGPDTYYNGYHNVQLSSNTWQITKTTLSSDWSLQLDSMKLELLVIADQHAAVNTFPGLVHTARHAMGFGFTLSRSLSCAHSKIRDWGEVVTR
jgi:hypothetical protein